MKLLDSKKQVYKTSILLETLLTEDVTTIVLNLRLRIGYRF